eukprot:4407031-Alexandrium_andersonii.AAC.1
MEIRRNLQQGRLPSEFGSGAQATGNLVWGRYNLMTEPRFGPRDMPAFGMFLHSAALLRNVSCPLPEVQQHIPEVQVRAKAIQDAIDSILVMENEFDIFVQTNLTDIWKDTLRLEY